MKYMKQIKDIQGIIDEGKTSEAHFAINEILALGPNNVEALKMRANLYHYEGRFEKEYAVWTQILSIDREDPDAINFFLQKQLEDREYFYFTDASSGEGRKFLAYPKDMLSMVTFGLMGCMLFLIANKLATVYTSFTDPEMLLMFLFLFVIAPWFFIVASYIKSLRFVVISQKGIEIATRIKKVKYAWTDIEKIYLVHGTPGENFGLSLLLKPNENEKPLVEIDINPDTSSLRAVPHFVKEVSKSFGQLLYTNNENPAFEAEIEGRTSVTF